MLPPADQSNHCFPRPAHRLQRGFTLMEVAMAVAIFATVLMGMLALLANGIQNRAEVRRITTGMQLSQQIHQSMRANHPGSGNIPANPGDDDLLGEFLPIDFRQFPPPGQPPYALGFDTEGKKRGSNLSVRYEDGVSEEGVMFLATLEGRPVPGNPGLTEILIGIEQPADAPRIHRQRREYQVLMPAGTDGSEEGGSTP